MPTTLEPQPLIKPVRRRAEWRQKLVDAERGLTSGFRADSNWFVYLFVYIALLAIGGVLDLQYYDWLLVGLSVTIVLTAELMQQALRAAMVELSRLQPTFAPEKAIHLATAAVYMAFLGSSLVIALIYARRIDQLFG
jgi:diacylglycerol kinase